VQIRRTDIPEVLLLEPTLYRDDRGFFLETYHAARYAESGITGPFVQDNHSRSVSRALRGLHLQIRHPQAKLVRVIRGAIFDVAVDVRRGSPTFRHWVGVTLTADNFLQCYIPEGFAHGFCVLSEDAEVEYKCTALYDPQGELGIAWNDPAIGIEWPVSDPILSVRDRSHPALHAVVERLPSSGAVPSEML
jgi:dTDP-4-dehydrorhamnose 3,5-epimerase